MGMAKNRMVYVVYGHVDCDCKPVCPTKGIHIWAVVGSELIARGMCDEDDTLTWEGIKFNEKVKPGQTTHPREFLQ